MSILPDLAGHRLEALSDVQTRCAEYRRQRSTVVVARSWMMKLLCALGIASHEYTRDGKRARPEAHEAADALPQSVPSGVDRRDGALAVAMRACSEG